MTDGKQKFIWDGTDSSGNKCPDGIYSIQISSKDEAGNKFSTVLNALTLDSRETKAYITAEVDGISPNADGKVDAQKFSSNNSKNDKNKDNSRFAEIAALSRILFAVWTFFKACVNFGAAISANQS